jgi:hypothetical protein
MSPYLPSALLRCGSVRLKRPMRRMCGSVRFKRLMPDWAVFLPVFWFWSAEALQTKRVNRRDVHPSPVRLRRGIVPSVPSRPGLFSIEKAVTGFAVLKSDYGRKPGEASQSVNHGLVRRPGLDCNSTVH